MHETQDPTAGLVARAPLGVGPEYNTIYRQYAKENTIPYTVNMLKLKYTIML